MLVMKDTRILRSVHESVLGGVEIAEEGIPLQYVKEGGKTVVTTGVAGGLFAGVSLSRNSAPLTVPAVLEFAIPADGVIDLGRTPIVGQFAAVIDGIAFTVVTAAPSSGEVRIVGSTAVFNTADKGNIGKITFRYVPDVQEAITIVGQAPIGGLASSALGVIGTIKEGVIGTTLFDASADWEDAMFVKLGNGVFAPAAADDAARIPNVIVKSAPAVESAYLVLSLNVA